MENNDNEYKIEDIKRIHLNKNDVLKITVKEGMSADSCRALHKMLSDMFPDNKILTITKGVEFEIIEGGNDNV